MNLPRIASLATLLACALAISACANTIRGVGRDASNTVDATEGAVRDIAN
jgi:predicted small secreted protein